MCLCLCVCLSVVHEVIVLLQNRLNRFRCGLGCGLVGPREARIRRGPGSPWRREQGHFGGDNGCPCLLPILVRCRYSQRYPRGAAAMRPLDTSTVATCFACWRRRTAVVRRVFAVGIQRGEPVVLVGVRGSPRRAELGARLRKSAADLRRLRLHSVAERGE